MNTQININRKSTLLSLWCVDIYIYAAHLSLLFMLHAHAHVSIRVCTIHADLYKSTQIAKGTLVV